MNLNTGAMPFLAFAALSVPSVGYAAPVDLTGWQADGGSSTWTVQSGNDSVLQTVNGAPTIFYDPTATSTQGTALSGTVRVNTTSDDDFIGFALGYDAGEIFSSTADFYLIDWKKGTQAGWNEGLSISHVTNGSSGNTTGTNGSFWQHTGGQVTEIARASTLGSTGWVSSQTYTFDIEFTSSSIKVEVDGVTQFDLSAAQFGLSNFDDGSFGFYNYSQANVLYAGIQQEEILGEITGVKFNDLNGNGLFDSGEQGLAGWLIQLADLQGNVLATTTTGADGDFAFTSLLLGTYSLTEITQDGWVQTAGDGQYEVFGNQPTTVYFGNRFVGNGEPPPTIPLPGTLLLIVGGLVGFRLLRR